MTWLRPWFRPILAGAPAPSSARRNTAAAPVGFRRSNRLKESRQPPTKRSRKRRRNPFRQAILRRGFRAVLVVDRSRDYSRRVRASQLLARADKASLVICSLAIVLAGSAPFLGSPGDDPIPTGFVL